MTLFSYTKVYMIPFLVFRQLRSTCRLLHLLFNKLFVNHGFEVRSVTVIVFKVAYLSKTNDRVELK